MQLGIYVILHYYRRIRDSSYKIYSGYFFWETAEYVIFVEIGMRINHCISMEQGWRFILFGYAGTCYN